MSQKYRVVYHDFVEKDLLSAISYYNSRQKGLGKRFFNEYISHLNLIKRNPFLYRKRYLDIQAAPLKTFPFLVFYLVNDDKIIILAVLHTSQDPENWPKK